MPSRPPGLQTARDAINIRTTALVIAAGNGHADVLTLLLAAGAEVDVRDSRGATALMHAVHGGHERAGVTGGFSERMCANQDGIADGGSLAGRFVAKMEDGKCISAQTAAGLMLRTAQPRNPFTREPLSGGSVRAFIASSELPENDCGTPLGGV